MPEQTFTKLILDGLVAFGTIAVAILAIWGDWFRAKFAPSKLVMLLHNKNGEPTMFGQTRAMYYHLKVVNRRLWLPGKDCRVLLKGLSRRGPDGMFNPISLPVPLQYIWAPAEFTAPVVTVVKEQIVDFGVVREGGNRFVPTLYTTPTSFSGHVGPNEAVRYHLEIEAVNFSSQRQIFEVAWDGVWSHEPSTMAQHLVIKEVDH
jgi:hypothetical protein